MAQNMAESDCDRVEVGKYLINHYVRHETDAIIVFASAGAEGLGEPIEEFKTTLLPFPLSMIFVIDRKISWYNHPEAPTMFEHVASLAERYQNVAVLGESMGASGALAFASYSPGIGRILALAPQYSVALPFILFDKRFASVGRANPLQTFWTFAPTAALPKATILFGNRDWLDSVHAGMYVLEGFRVGFVDGAGHLVARYLKKGTSENKLYEILQRFLDFTRPYDLEATAQILGPLLNGPRIDPDFGLFAEKSRSSISKTGGASSKRLPPPPNGIDFALGRPTNQSSLSNWSLGKTTEQDSANAVSEGFYGPFAFHTAKDKEAWWSVDFEQLRWVNEIRIYNRIDNVTSASRCLNFAIDGSQDGAVWDEVFRKADSKMFGGSDGKPFIWIPAAPFYARYVRIRLLKTNFLHFEKIEMFGVEQCAQGAKEDLPSVSKAG